MEERKKLLQQERSRHPIQPYREHIRLMQDMELSFTQVADLLGCTPQHVWSALNGRIRSEKALGEIEAVLLDAAECILGDEDEDQEEFVTVSRA